MAGRNLQRISGLVLSLNFGLDLSLDLKSTPQFGYADSLLKAGTGLFTGC
ncbi:MAG: hypothetical protein JWL81_1127 [Verrucomicrobiales bacterium]|nr:hypothetical protein [Verrucomicrobiales bacterium]